jgi:hypothetical protein
MIIVLIFSACKSTEVVQPEPEIVQEEQDEFSDYFRNLIERGEMKLLPLLEAEDRMKYGLIIAYLKSNFENPVIEDYYYFIGTNYDFRNHRTEHVYAIYYYERLYKRYSSYRGDPTGKCFFVIFNENHEFLRVDRVR